MFTHTNAKYIIILKLSQRKRSGEGQGISTKNGWGLFFFYSHPICTPWWWGTFVEDSWHPYSRICQADTCPVPLYDPFLFFFFPSFVFSGPHPQRVEVPRLRVESELQLPTCTTATATPVPSQVCDLYHSSQQHWILNPLARPGIEPSTPWFLVGFVSTVPQWELHTISFHSLLCPPESTFPFSSSP